MSVDGTLPFQANSHGLKFRSGEGWGAQHPLHLQTECSQKGCLKEYPRPFVYYGQSAQIGP